jgi:hypothetical protein
MRLSAVDVPLSASWSDWDSNVGDTVGENNQAAGYAAFHVSKRSDYVNRLLSVCETLHASLAGCSSEDPDLACRP